MDEPARICLRGATWRLYPCILWTGAPNSTGYGAIGVRISRGKWKTIGVHRWTLIDKLGRPLRQGYEACHHCDVRRCIQPEHLYEGTKRDNVRDCRERNERFGSLPKLTSEQQTEVRRRYAAGGITQRELALEFGVSAGTISNVVRQAFSFHLSRSHPVRQG